jgi:hypothetical protein
MSRRHAEALYEHFHKYGPKSRTRAPSSFRIPTSMYLAGKGEYVLYSSPKFDPITYAKPDGPLNYIHEHDSRGVNVYLRDNQEGGPSKKVPRAIANAQELTCLGRCIGFAYDSGGEEVLVECDPKIVEWYAVPNPSSQYPKGHALLAIESKRRVLAMVWGGKLRVEPRGIVG